MRWVSSLGQRCEEYETTTHRASASTDAGEERYRQTGEQTGETITLFTTCLKVRVGVFSSGARTRSWLWLALSVGKAGDRLE